MSNRSGFTSFLPLDSPYKGLMSSLKTLVFLLIILEILVAEAEAASSEVSAL